MAKRLITKTDWSLPPSTIYLDDLKEIEEIVRSCFDANDTPPKFVYEVDREFLVDSIEELEAHQGRATSLEVYAGNISSASTKSDLYRTFILDLSRFSSSVSAPYGSKMSEREFYSQVKDVLELRKHSFRTSFDSLPRWGLIGIDWLLWACSMILVGTVLLFFHMGIIHSKIVMIICAISGSSLGLLASAVSLSAAISNFRGRFRINLFYLRQSQLKKSESHKSFLGKVGWVLLGGLATLFFQWISGFFKH